MDSNSYKVGSRVEVYTEWQGRLGWWLGRIIGVTRTGTHWQVRLDVETRPYKHVTIAGDESATKLRHSNAPLPKAQPSQRAGYMPEGELARQLEAAKQFKLGDRIELKLSTDKIGTIVAMDSKSFLFQPDGSTERFGHFLNALAFARKIDTPDPEPRKSYEFKIGDIFEQSFNGQVRRYEIVAITGDLITYLAIEGEAETGTRPRAWLNDKILVGSVVYKPRKGTPLSARITVLSARADQLDDQIARLMDERAKIDHTLAALRAISEDSASEL